MAFTRNFLKALGLTDEQVGTIIEEHTNVTDALKAQRDKFENDAKALKVEADKVPGLQQQLNEAQGGEDYKAKYDKEHQDFEDYKAKIAKDAEIAKIKDAYRQLLIDEKISDKRLDVVIRATDFSNMKLGKDGKLEGVDDLKKQIGDEWSDFKVSTTERKQKVPTPPDHDNSGGTEGRARELYKKHLQQMGVEKDSGKE